LGDPGSVDGIGTPLDPNHELIIEFGKKQLAGALDNIQDFVKLMIPLTTGLITAYLALLNFMGIENITGNTPGQAWSFIEPTYFMLGSLATFIVVSFPIIQSLSIGSISSIKTFRDILIVCRYGGTGLAAAFL
jgi:hypothetical protein